MALNLPALNRKYPVGTMVRYWPMARDGEGRIGAIRSIWWRLGSGHVVVKVTGYPGGIAATHVEPLTVDDIAALMPIRGEAREAKEATQ